MTSLLHIVSRCALALLTVLLAVPVQASPASEIAFHKGVRAFGSGHLSEARQLFEASLVQDPTDAAAQRYLALIASREGDAARAVDLYRRVLELEPDSIDSRFELGRALLQAGEPAAARAAFDAVLQAQPSRADARLWAGISRYREGRYAEALPFVENEAGLDDGQRIDARYYAGLAHAHLGDAMAASAAFSAVEEVSLTHPLVGAAADFSYTAPDPAPSAPPRRFSAEVTTGVEWDSNVTFVGSIPAILQPENDELNRQRDLSALAGLRSRYSLYSSETAAFVVGYDGFVSFHEDIDDVDRQIHVGSLAAAYRFEPVTLGLLYEAAYSFVGHSDFERAHRVTASGTLPTQGWGVLQAYARFQDIGSFIDDFSFAPAGFEKSPLDRDGQRYTLGLNQGVFLPAGSGELRFGAAVDRFDSHGTEYRYDGIEVSAGYSLTLQQGAGFDLGWRRAWRDYGHTRVLDTARRSSTDEVVDLLTGELHYPLSEKLLAKLAGSVLMSDSEVGVYDYNRAILGAYVTYRF